MLCLLSFVIAIPAVRAAKEGWPEGYEIAEKSESPNGRYGVLLPSRETAQDLDEDKIVNKLVDFKTSRSLCVIHGVQYFPGQNHYGLKVKWAPDSSWCAVTYDARYGFGKITLVEIENGKCRQSDLGGYIQGALDEAITKESHKVQTSGYGDAFFRPGPKHTILVRATAYTNPKSFEDQPTNYVRFQGTFDLNTHKWTQSSAAGLDNWDALSAAYRDDLEPDADNDEDRAKQYDERLNVVYSAVRAVLPAERFAAVKKQQIAWLKQLETRDSAAAKCQLLRARIKELSDLLW
jgi:hypothetical protein